MLPVLEKSRRGISRWNVLLIVVLAGVASAVPTYVLMAFRESYEPSFTPRVVQFETQYNQVPSAFPVVLGPRIPGSLGMPAGMGGMTSPWVAGAGQPATAERATCWAATTAPLWVAGAGQPAAAAGVASSQPSPAASPTTGDGKVPSFDAKPGPVPPIDSTALEGVILRQIKAIRLFPLHGTQVEMKSLEKAIAFVESYEEFAPSPKPVARYEIHIRHDNEDEIKATFIRKDDALSFLHSYLPPLKPAAKERK